MNYVVDAPHVFIFLFIMLGPVKMLIPYAKATAHLDKKQLTTLSWKSALIGTIITIFGAYAGMILLGKWGLPVPVLLLAAGIVFFLGALKIVLGHSLEPTDAPLPVDRPPPSVMQVVFPMIITPYGMAALIAFFASSDDLRRTGIIVGLLLFVMLLNLLCMIFVRPILKLITPTGMQITFAVLGVMLVALALQIIITSARHIGLLPLLA